jgi:hypothetical protein
MAPERARPWILGAAHCVAAYLGEFPDDVDLAIHAEPGHEVRFGVATVATPPSVTVWAGAGTSPARLRDDWVLVHELLHVGFPGLPEDGAWLTEGMATYGEPLARAAGGLRTEQDAWAALHASLPQGEPRRNDAGLEGTGSWAGRYWGGALWCFSADVALREATGGAWSLPRAQRAVAETGGTLRVRWPTREAIRALDDATETDVFGALYDRHAWEARPFGFAALWRRAQALGMVAGL